MKIDLKNMNRDSWGRTALENFRVTEDGELLLFCSKIGTIWTEENLIFRSSVWNKGGELVSPSFKKFFNWDEQPDIESKPTSLKECHCIEKVDGSTLIVSKYKNKIIKRTRGTLDATIHENGFEIDQFEKRYPKAFDPPEYLSYIYEWVSPTNRIILDYADPDIYLTNVIQHEDYSYFKQNKVDEVAKEIGVKRPKVFNFSDIQTMITTITELEGVEGICVYYHGDQYIRKIKSVKYLTLHKMKSYFSEKDIITYYVKNALPNYKEFIDIMTAELDYEIVSMMLPDISKVVDASKEVKEILNHCKKFADSVRSITRKEAAAKVFSSYGKTNRTAVVFNYLDNKEPDEKMLKTLLTQIVLKGK
jgi:hypothetical protein